MGSTGIGLGTTSAGRPSLRAAIDGGWQTVRRGESAMFAVIGAAGVGKTHVVEDFVAEAQAAGAATAVARCHEGISNPLVSIRRLLRDLERNLPPHPNSPLAGVTELLAGSGPTGDIGRIAFEVATAIVDATARVPTIVVIEDTHWADATTLTLLLHLIDECSYGSGRLPLMLLVTSRDDEDRVDGRVLDSIDTARNGRVLRLPALHEVEMFSLLRDEVRDRPSIRLVGLVHAASDGNPLHAIGLVRALADQGALERRDGVVDTNVGLHELAKMEDPGRVLRLRLATRSDDERRALAALAILGGEASLGDLSRLVPDADVMTAMKAGAASGLVSVVGDRHVFAHAEYRSAVYLDVDADDRAALHARVAIWFDDAGIDPMSTASHALAAGSALDPKRRHELLLAGARDADAGSSWDSAVTLYAGALESADVLGLDRRTTLGIRLRAGIAAARLLDRTRADRLLTEVIDNARELEELAIWAEAVEYRTRYVGAVDWAALFADPVMGQFDEVLSLGDRLPACNRARIEGLYAESLTMAGHHAEARRRSDTAEMLAASPAGRSSLGRARFAGGVAAIGRMDLEEARVRLDHALAASMSEGDEVAVMWCLVRSAGVALQTGRLDDAELLVARATAAAGAQRNWAEESFATAVRSAVAAARGDMDTCIRSAIEAVAMHERANYVLTPALSATCAARAYALQGESPRARKALEEWFDTAYVPRVSRLSVVAATGVDTGEFRRRDLDWQPPLTLFNASALALIADVAHALGRVDVAEELLPHIDDAIRRGVRIVPEGAISLLRVQAQLRWTIDRDDAAIRLMEAAVAEDERIGAQTEVAAGALAVAEALAALGEIATDRAHRAVERAATTARRLGLSSLVSRAGHLIDIHEVAALRTVGSGVPRVPADYRAVLFTDVVGSTALGVVHGDAAYLRLIRVHDEIVRARLAEFGGLLFKTAGDGAYTWFTDAGAAVRCALAIVEDVAMQPPDRSGELLEIRAGVADGTPIEQDGDLFGTAVNLAARVSDLPEIGSVWTTASVRDHCADPDFCWESRGLHDLKGFPDPIELLAVGRGVPRSTSVTTTESGGIT